MAAEKENEIYPGKPIIYAENVHCELAARSQWNIPKLPDVLKTLPPIRIYNVSDILHQRSMGGLGTFVIQPCAPGMPCSVPLEIPMIFTEAIPVKANQMEYRIHDGREVAENIIGTAKHSGEADKLWGCFIARGDSPTPDELQVAQDALLRKYVGMAAEALAFYMDAPRERNNITGQHRKALGVVAEKFKNRIP